MSTPRDYDEQLVVDDLRPERIFQKMSQAEIEYEPMDHDEDQPALSVRDLFRTGRAELALDYEYIGYECRTVLSLDEETVEELARAFAEIADLEVSET